MILRMFRRKDSVEDNQDEQSPKRRRRIIWGISPTAYARLRAASIFLRQPMNSIASEMIILGFAAFSAQIRERRGKEAADRMRAILAESDLPHPDITWLLDLYDEMIEMEKERREQKRLEESNLEE